MKRRVFFSIWRWTSVGTKKRENLTRTQQRTTLIIKMLNRVWHIDFLASLWRIVWQLTTTTCLWCIDQFFMPGCQFEERRADDYRQQGKTDHRQSDPELTSDEHFSMDRAEKETGTKSYQEKKQLSLPLYSSPMRCPANTLLDQA